MWLLAGCAAQEPGDPCEAGDAPALAIGTGEYAFEALAAGDAVELVHGPQGGYHVLIGLEAAGLDASAPWGGLVVGWLGGEERARSAPVLTMRCNADAGALQSWGTLLIWDAEPEALDGQPITVDADVVDAAGTVASATIDLVIEDPLLE